MARTKTTSKFADRENTQIEHSPSPPQNAAADQTSDQQPLNETPVHTTLPDVIIPAFDTPKFSKPKSSKKPIIKPRPVPTRRSQRMKKSSKEPKVSHVNLVSDEEKKTYSNSEEKDSQEIGLTPHEIAINQRRKEIATEVLPLSTSSEEKKEVDSNDEEENSALDDEEMDETYEEEIKEDPEEEMEEDSEQTLIEIVQATRKSYKDKKVASPSKEESASQNKDENVETAEENEPSPNKYGRGKDITKVDVVMKAQKQTRLLLDQ